MYGYRRGMSLLSRDGPKTEGVYFVEKSTTEGKRSIHRQEEARVETKNMRLMRYKDACEATGLGRKKVRELAREAKAMYKIDKAVVIDMNRLIAYLDKFYLVDAEDD